MDKNKVIDISHRWIETQEPGSAAVMDLLNAMPKEEANAILQFALVYMVKEVEAGLGLIDSDDDMELLAFEQIDKVYQKAAEGCYFCDKSVDPNETRMDKDTKLCMMCQLKLRNFVEALGIPANKVFKWMK